MQLEILFKLLTAHAIGDFSFQPKEMVELKNRNINKKASLPWFYWMAMHCFINGGLVYLATGSSGLGMLEVILHWTIDHFKCEKKINPFQD